MPLDELPNHQGSCKTFAARATFMEIGSPSRNEKQHESQVSRLNNITIGVVAHLEMRRGSTCGGLWDQLSDEVLAGSRPADCASLPTKKSELHPPSIEMDM